MILDWNRSVDPGSSGLRSNGYGLRDLGSDLIAGIVVSVMIVPQVMAYALLAGLPAQAGLYAGIAGLALYGIFGTSRSLSVGPVGLISLLVGARLLELSGGDPSQTWRLAALMALLVGVLQMALGMLRAGVAMHFLSRPVITGFVAIAALSIAASQLEHLFGLPHASMTTPWKLLRDTLTNLPAIQWHTAGLGVAGVILLVCWPWTTAQSSRLLRLPQPLRVATLRCGPLILVGLSTLLVSWAFEHEWFAVAVVGEVPSGLPQIRLPVAEQHEILALLPFALVVAALGFIESASVAESLARRRRERVDADRELLALGLANTGAAFLSGFPVAGSFGRTMVNDSAGARSGLASLFAAAIVCVVLAHFTPLFYYLPRATLAAVIIVAVFRSVEWKALRFFWVCDRMDSANLLVTVLSVLILGFEIGIATGVFFALAGHVWRTSRPHVTMVERVDRFHAMRDVVERDATAHPTVLAFRIDESLYFANARFVETQVHDILKGNQGVEHMVLVASGVNRIDATALEILDHLRVQLKENGTILHLAEVKQPVYERLSRSGFLDHLAPGQMFQSTAEAVHDLSLVAAVETAVEPLPESLAPEDLPEDFPEDIRHEPLPVEVLPVEALPDDVLPVDVLPIEGPHD